MTAGLTSHIWQSTLFALAAGMLTLAVRRNRAHVRYWLWLTASLKFLLPFSVLMALGSHLGRAPVARQIAPPNLSFAIERIVEPFGAPLPLAPAPPPAANWTGAALLSVWIGGLAAIVLLRLRGWRRIRTALRASTPLEIPAAVEIRSAQGLIEPGVVGWLRPLILLPAGIERNLTPDQLEAVLAHELCHVRRHDNLLAAIHMIVESLFWFHPLVWWIGARLVEERERACDEAVLHQGSQPRTYADAILNVCKLYIESPLPCISGVTGANLKRRIEAIMTNRATLGLNRAKKLLLAFAAAMALACPIAVGVMIGIGNTTAIHAQSAPPPQRDTPPSPQVDTPTPAAQTAPAPPKQFADHRLIALFFDLDVMTHDDQLRVQHAVPGFLRNEIQLQPGDLVAVLAANESRVSVLQDFTANPGMIESAVAKIGSMSTSTPAAPLLSRLETAVRMLGALEGKKLLVYFSNRIEQARAEDPARLQDVVNAAVRANVALSPIDTTKLAAAPVPNRIENAGNASTQPKFEVASVKRADQCQFDSSIDPGSVAFRGMPLRPLLMEAFRVKMDQIDGPSWLDTDCFEISARIPEGAAKDQIPAMLQALLADRFKLLAHQENRPRSGYALVVDKNGPKFKEDTRLANFMGKAPQGSTKFGFAGQGYVKGVMTMASLADRLSNRGYGPVQDLTGLTGKYDIELTWAPDPTVEPRAFAATASAATPPGADIPAPETANLFTALRETLGLKLERHSMQVKFVVIDRIERIPTGN